MAITVDNLEKGGHRLRIVGQEDSLLTFLDGKRYVVEQYRTVGVEGFQTFYLENLIAWLTFHLEDDAWIFTCRWCDLFNVELLQHLFAGSSLLRFCDVGRETAYEFFELLALLVSFHLLVLCLAQSELAGLIPERIVAREDCHLAKVYIHGLCGNSIEEVAVVGHYEHALFEVAEIFLQPLYGVKIEVVGGLVEE